MNPNLPEHKPVLQACDAPGLYDNPGLLADPLPEPIVADDPSTPYFDELTGEFRAEPEPVR